MSPLPALGSFAFAGESNSYESISTVTVGSGGSSTITFSSIPSTYKHLQIRYMANFTGTSVGYSQPYCQFNSDTATNYDNHALYGTGSAAGASYFAAGGAYGTWIPDSAYANTFGVGVIDILDYTNTNKYSTVRTLGGFNRNYNASANELIGITSALWRNTAAITSIDIKGTTTFSQYSSFALYGIKG